MAKKYVEMPMTFDPMFKGFMGGNDNRRYLARTIMVVTGIDENLILEKGEIINSELLIERQKEKAKRSDLIIVVGKNIVNIEMNNDLYYKEKNYNYMHKISYEQTKKGEEYDKDVKIIQINFDMDQMYNVDKPVLKFMMRDESGIIDNYNFVKYVIPLERIKDKYYNNKKGMSELEELASLLVINNKKELEKIKESGNEIMKEAAEKIEKLREDENLIGVYDAKEADRKYMNTKIHYAKDEGITEGKEQGSKEKQIEIATTMLENNVPIKDILKYTGLTDEEIKNITE